MPKLNFYKNISNLWDQPEIWPLSSVSTRQSTDGVRYSRTNLMNTFVLVITIASGFQNRLMPLCNIRLKILIILAIDRGHSAQLVLFLSEFSDTKQFYLISTTLFQMWEEKTLERAGLIRGPLSRQAFTLTIYSQDHNNHVLSSF